MRYICGVAEEEGGKGDSLCSQSLAKSLAARDSERGRWLMLMSDL